MAVRYSGDAEVRVRWDDRRGAYLGTVLDPTYRWLGIVYGPKPRGPEDYDRAAVELLRGADRDRRREKGGPLAAERDGRRIRIRRIFQAPCPIKGAPDCGSDDRW